jgi:putative ABC transport system permease protein
VRSLLSLLMRLYPAEYRARFGHEMREQMLLDYQHARARGFFSVLPFVAISLWDLTRSALLERLAPSWRSRRSLVLSNRRALNMLGDTWVDFVHALRCLRRAPRFVALAAGTLGLALGALAGIFSVVEAVLLRPLPFPDPDRLVFIVGSAPGTEMPAQIGASPELYVQYQDAQLLEDIAFQGFGGARTIRAGDRSERISIWSTSTSLFSTLGVQPAFGRFPVREDASKVAVISHQLWTTMFASDPDVIGRTVEADGALRTIIAVMPPDFWWLNDAWQMWTPYEITAADVRAAGPSELGQFEIRLVGRMRPGVTREAVIEELNELSRRLPERFGGSPEYASTLAQYRAVVTPMKEGLAFSNNAEVLWTLFGSAAMVLLIACANVASLFLVRGERRQSDHAVRTALGGTRTRLIRVGLAEAFVVALLASALAVVFAQLAVPIFLDTAPYFTARLGQVRLSTTILFTLAGAIFCALVCGFLPAIRASSPRYAHLREGGKGATRRRRWGQSGLVVTQTALALVLLIGSVLLLKRFVLLHSSDLGYETEDIMTFQFAPEGADLVDGAAYVRLHLDFMERIASLPEVESVGVVNNVPLDEAAEPMRFLTDAAGPTDGILLDFTFTGGDYFETMGIEVERGRVFTREDHTSQPGNVLISRSAADQLWPAQDPLGQRIRREDRDDWHTVVGVTEDIVQAEFGRVTPLVYFPLNGPTPTSWRVTSPGYVVKTARAEAIAPEIRELIREAAPGAPMYAISTMEVIADDELRLLRFVMMILSLGALLALLLSAVGLFGVLSYVVAERTPEIGVRIYLGAKASAVRAMVVGQGAGVVLIGVFAGLALSALGTRILGSILFGTTAVDVMTFAVVAAVMIGVGLLASYLPARRASSVDPVEALKGT